MIIFVLADEKPGRCPPTIASSSGLCINRCTTDLSCPGREKCCSNGCGTICLPPTLGGTSFTQISIFMITKYNDTFIAVNT